MPEATARSRLRRWARKWIERFEPYGRFLDSLRIRVAESRLYRDLFSEALMKDLNCRVIIANDTYAYLLCGQTYVRTLASSTLKGPGRKQSEADEFFEKRAKSLQASYVYSSIIHVTVYDGEKIKAERLSEIFGETVISEITVKDWWSTIQLTPWNSFFVDVGTVTFTPKITGKIEITWQGEIARRKLESVAEQDIANHLQELDEALAELYTVVKAGMKGIVSYVLY
jgi:hypothetical protein